MTSFRPVTVLVLSGDLAVRAVACTLVERAGLAVQPAASIDEAARLVGALDGPVILLVDQVTPGPDLAPLRDRLGDADELAAPVITPFPSDASVDLAATLERLVGDAMRQLAERHPLVLDGPDEPSPRDAPTLESAVLWETIAIERVRPGDFISWTPVLGGATCTAFLVAIRPLRLGTMAGWIIETSGVVTWMPRGARVQRARAGEP